MRVGGVVLCGGRSSRMGRAKAWLPFGGEPLLARVLRAVRAATDEVVVVAAPGQDVPPLPPGTRLVFDEDEGKGPLAGLAAGLAALAGTAEWAFLSACDAPFLTPAFVRAVLGAARGEEPLPPTPSPQKGGGADTRRADESLIREAASGSLSGSASLLSGEVEEGFRAAAPFIAGRPHPLAAAYSLGVLPVVRAMLGANELRMTDLLARVPTRVLSAEELAHADPDLRALRNLNTPEEYAAALQELGAS